MNPNRVSNADIDTDYGKSDRIRTKYYMLHDHLELDSVKSAEIITFNTIEKAGAIRDVCKGLYKGVRDDYKQIADYICAGVDTDEDNLREEYPDVFEYVDILEGTVVSVGSHPSGVLISDLDIARQVGLCTTKDSEYPVSMLNMKELDALMYVKMDALGLDNVELINGTGDLLGLDYKITPDNIPLDDENVWKSIRDDTTLIFQWESKSARSYLKRFMSDKTIEIAKKCNPNFSYIKWFSFGNGLIRPGCASFRDNVANGEILTTGFEELDDFLAITMGRITMQEDIMRFLVRFCGYSDAESDTVRRAIAKKYGTENQIDEIHDRFISYSHETFNQPVELLENIFPPIKQGILDATRYAFSWNHSDAYSCVGYICGYLRYYHKLEFLTAALNTFSSKPEKTTAIMAYIVKEGVVVKPAKFRHSAAKYICSKEENAIYKGIGSVKYLSDVVGDDLYRLRNNEYKHFIDLLYDMVYNTSADFGEIEILIKIDYFNEFGGINHLLSVLNAFKDFYKRKQISKDMAGKTVFGYHTIRNAAYKETDKTLYLDAVSRYNILCNYEDTIDDVNCVPDIIENQLEYLGYISYTDEDMDGRIAYVTDVDAKYSPRLSLYRIKDGKTCDIKVYKKKQRGRNDIKLFGQDPLEVGDAIYLDKCKREPKTKFNNATQSYENVPGEFVWWLTNYHKVKI